MIKSIIPTSSNTHLLLEKIHKGGKYTTFGFSREEKLWLISEVDCPVLYIAQNEQDARNIVAKIGETSALLSTFLYPTTTDTHSSYLNNLSKIQQLNNGNIKTLVAYPATLTAYFEGETKEVILEVGKEYKRDQLISLISSCGYVRVDSVASGGDYAIHGDSIDIFLYEGDILRLSFFDLELEEISLYSPDTFQKLDSLKSYTLLSNMVIPVKDEIFYDKVTHEIDKKLKNSKSVFQRQSYENIKALVEIDKGLSHISHQDYYLPFLKPCTLFDKLDQNVLIVFDEYKITYDKFDEFYKSALTTIQEQIENGIYLENHLNMLTSIEEVKNSLQTRNILAFGNISSNNRWFVSNSVFNIKTLPILKYVDRVDDVVKDCVSYLKQGYEVVLFGQNETYVSRLKAKFESARVGVEVIKSLATLSLGHIHLLAKEYPYSFGLEHEKIIVLGTSSLFEATKRKKEADLDVFTSLPSVGDFVVHSSYGIARYDGNVMLTSDNGQKEYLVLKYKNDDTVYLPVENLDRLSKFVGTKDAPQLSKLGGGEFLKVKEKVKAGLKELAFSLVALYKERENKKGIVYPRDAEMEGLLDSNFKYTLTKDQEKAILDIYEDMASGKIMDRLICGDVGYGKTEVAIRAILKTVLGGYQVAFLCPTTILSEQHYRTCMERLSSFGVRVGVLNRFKNTSEQKALISKVASGDIDVLIGTHRLLSKDVVFKNLGLLVLDEEQKFGVADKEKIKNLKKDINVLTLSATPIPRTLHMSLMGIRDISLIALPPLSRLDCITQVVEYSDDLLCRAINKELDRGGQALIVYNHVESMTSFYARIKSILPSGTKVGMAHSQMDEKTLENAIYSLYNKEIDVLIATTLIENGIDLPSANTLIVIDSHALGLSQLYQLKGRVGRSDKQAYAYFTYAKDKMFTDNAYKRLEAIGQYATLGSGYKIALRDLEIRGAGNVLGVEQSGHMGKVGYHMYMTLLSQAVDEIQGKEQCCEVESQVITTIDAYLPQEYVSGQVERTSIYSKIAKIQNRGQLETIYGELTSTYGRVPSVVENLLYIACLKNLASKYGFKKVVVRQKIAYLEWNIQKEYQKITKLMEKLKDTFSMDVSSSTAKLVLNECENVKENIIRLVRLLEENE